MGGSTTDFFRTTSSFLASAPKNDFIAFFFFSADSFSTRGADVLLFASILAGTDGSEGEKSDKLSLAFGVG